MNEPRWTVRGLQARAVNVPMRLPLQTGGGTVGVAPLVLIDLETDAGETGHAYLFCYTPLVLVPVLRLLEELTPLIVGDALAPLDIERKLQARFRLLGAKGPVAMALAGIDMAAWDALARAQGVPLVRLLGGTPRRVTAYNSNGLGMIGAARAADEAARLAQGFGAIKVRLGYASLREDVAVVRAVRGGISDGVRLMSDYNQSQSVPEAMRRIEALAGEGLEWVEEPVTADDFEGCARIRARSRIPVQIGENWWGPHEMARSLAAGASDLGMPDAMKIGGVSAWMRAAALAEAAGMPLSSHLFPEVSAHLLAASPTCHWLEYVDWAEPVLRRPLTFEDGAAVIADEPGTGIEWDEAAVARYRVE